MENYFAELNAINVGDKIEKKNGLSYLSWAWAWAEVKKRHPDATYTIYENSAGLFYHTDGKTCWVKTGVTVNGIEHIEYLPVMDFKNKSIPVDNVTSFDVNKAIQRSLTKACARHGLGLYIYAGEDLPEDDTAPKNKENDTAPKKKTVDDAFNLVNDFNMQIWTCEKCGNEIEEFLGKNRSYSIGEVVEKSMKNFGGHVYCVDCAREIKNADKERNDS